MRTVIADIASTGSISGLKTDKIKAVLNTWHVLSTTPSAPGRMFQVNREHLRTDLITSSTVFRKKHTQMPRRVGVEVNCFRGGNHWRDVLAESQGSMLLILRVLTEFYGFCTADAASTGNVVGFCDADTACTVAVFRPAVPVLSYFEYSHHYSNAKFSQYRTPSTIGVSRHKEREVYWEHLCNGQTWSIPGVHKNVNNRN